MTIRVKGLTQWAKNKIRQHGDTFLVTNDLGHKVCVRSLKETFKLTQDVWQTWCGWFDIGTDVEIIERI